VVTTWATLISAVAIVNRESVAERAILQKSPFVTFLGDWPGADLSGPLRKEETEVSTPRHGELGL
jgi:hypothetical protein